MLVSTYYLNTDVSYRNFRLNIEIYYFSDLIDKIPVAVVPIPIFTFVNGSL